MTNLCPLISRLKVRQAGFIMVKVAAGPMPLLEEKSE